jgi:hypothetical protein
MPAARYARVRRTRSSSPRAWPLCTCIYMCNVVINRKQRSWSYPRLDSNLLHPLTQPKHQFSQPPKLSVNND